MQKTGFFRVAVEGATTDGRTITRDWIEQMAANYNPATYTARINCEHIKGFSPDAPFNAYGSVAAVKAEEITLQLDGKPVKRLALFAQLDANDNLVSTVKAGQKIFTSVEIATNFAATGKAGLVGLAITDNPASLGCEALHFTALKPMFDARKTDAANLFTAAEEAAITIESSSDTQVSAIDKLTGALHQIVALFTAKPEPKPQEPKTELKPEPEPAAPAVNATAIDPAAFTALTGTLASALEGFNTATKANDAQNKKLAEDFAALKSQFDQLSRTEAPRAFRAPASGGNGKIQTNC